MLVNRMALFMNKFCFIDMDGVLADFVGHICAAHNRPNVYEHPDTKGISLGLFDIEKIWGMSATQFWEPTNSTEFWFSIPKTEEADLIIDTATDKFGESNIAILTAPSMSEGCFMGKKKWIDKYYPQFSKSIIYTGAKQFLGGQARVLIDDRDKNIDAFVEVGGKAILIPRLWNRRYPEVVYNTNSVVDTIRKEILERSNY